MGSFDVNAIIGRIREVRERFAGERGKSQFAHSLGISPSTYSYYEINRVPPIEVLIKICNVTDTDLNWLVTGKKTEKFSKYAENNIIGQGNYTLMRKISTLLASNPELIEPISAFIDILSQKKGIEERISQSRQELKKERPAWIPVLGRTAAGLVHFWQQQIIPESKQAVTELDELVKKYTGKKIIGFADGTISVDLQAEAVIDGLKESEANLVQISSTQSDDIVEFVQCEQIHKIFNDSFALRVDGDSMSPRVNDGDIIIVSPSVPAAQGQIGLVHIKNQIGVTCKLIRMEEENVHLIPINEKYETKIVNKNDLLWALAVLCHVSV
jgi:transcriptional regulator with XRE-family HTH domain